jgi:hypothetical protein
MDKKSSIIKQGYNEASTFPGFCEDHEKIFRELENKKEVASEVDCILQIFRSISREVVRLSYDVDRLGKLVELSTKLEIERANEKFQERIADIAKTNPCLKSFSLNIHVQSQMDLVKDFEIRRHDILHIEQSLINNLRLFLATKLPKDAHIHYENFVIPVQIPVTASGRVAIYLSDGLKETRLASISSEAQPKVAAAAGKIAST